MKKNMGEYNEGLKKLFGSFRKRFGLSYSETLEYVDENVEDKEYSVLYFSSDITYSKDLIEEINATGVGQAFGFYKDGPMAFSSVDEIKEAIPRIVGNGGNKFIFVELEERSRFRLEDINKTVFIKQGRKSGELYVDVVKSREYVEDEVIRKMTKKDKDEFNNLYNTLYMKRWEKRNDLFIKNYKMRPSELTMIYGINNITGAFLCFKKDVLVGFVVYESLEDTDNKGVENKRYLLVRDIYVLEEYRRQGIATRMVREVMQIASKTLTKRLRFKTWSMDEETVGFINSLNNKPLYAVYEIDL